MKYATIIVLHLFTTAPALAQLLPPPEFDRPYNGRLSVDTVPTQRSLAEICPNAAARTPNMIGCAVRANDGSHCRVILAPDSIIRALGASRQRILRHEIGHCNGWPAHHPGGRR
jgi:hypothetical protein